MGYFICFGSVFAVILVTNSVIRHLRNHLTLLQLLQSVFFTLFESLSLKRPITGLDQEDCILYELAVYLSTRTRQ